MKRAPFVGPAYTATSMGTDDLAYLRGALPISARHNGARWFTTHRLRLAYAALERMRARGDL